MIWALTREQVRSQRRYLVSAAVVIAVTVAVAAYGALMALTLTHSQLQIDHLLGYDRETAADASTGSGYVFEDLASNIDAANEQGHDVVAIANVWLELPSAVAWSSSIDLVALHGDLDWSTILVEGSAPESGQIVVNAQWARDNAVALGDTITLKVTPNGIDHDPNPDPSALTLYVSGISRSAVGTSGVQLYVPGGFVGWDNVPALNQAVADAHDSGPASVAVTVYGNGSWPWTTALAVNARPNGGASGPELAIATIAGIGTAALVVGLIAMAFAVGRAQAQARTKWVGTVRALGATKRQVASASLLESAVVGVAAGVVGFLLGALGTAIHLAFVATRVASPIIFAAPTGYLAIAAGAVVLAIVLALIVGAVPAFWSARVSPTAALKPATDLSDAKVSRDVRIWPLATTWLLAIFVVAFGASGGLYGAAAIAVVIAVVILAVSTVMLAHEVLRRTLPWHARRMSGSANRAVMVAGDAILARPRQSTIPAFIVALSTTVLMTLVVPVTIAYETSLALQGGAGGDLLVTSNRVGAPLWVVGVYAVAALLCIAVAIATGSVSAREAATREALGLTASQGRLASALQYLVAQGHGLALGLVGCVVGTAVLFAIDGSMGLDPITSWVMPVAAFTSLVLLIAGGFALVGAATAAAVSPRTAPLSRVEVSA